MDISFSTQAGGDDWPLEDCAKWASENDFDALRLVAHGAIPSDQVLLEVDEEVTGTLAVQDIYLAAITAHNITPEIINSGNTTRLRARSDSCCCNW